MSDFCDISGNSWDNLCKSKFNIMKKIFRLHPDGNLEYIGSNEYDESSIISKYIKSLNYPQCTFPCSGNILIAYCWRFNDGRLPWKFDKNEADTIEFRIQLSGKQLHRFLYREYGPSVN